MLARIRRRGLTGLARVHRGGGPPTHADADASPARSSTVGEATRGTTAIVRPSCISPRDKSALLFATSVENAKVLAALPHLPRRRGAGRRGPYERLPRTTPLRRTTSRRSRTGSSRTKRLHRGLRHPQVDAVFITGPPSAPRVPVMIGRGLAVPLNGGGRRSSSSTSPTTSPTTATPSPSVTSSISGVEVAVYD